MLKFTFSYVIESGNSKGVTPSVLFNANLLPFAEPETVLYWKAILIGTS
jgi:hypothetical protein